MKLSMMVAVSDNGVIGNKGELPWLIPSELAYFAKVTKGKTIVMGSNTLKSIGKLLDNREMIVLTTKRGAMLEYLNAKGMLPVRIANDMLDVKYQAKLMEKEVVVIGGSTVYVQYLPLVSTVYLTRVHTEVIGDAYFPELDPNVWLLESAVRVTNIGELPYTKEVWVKFPNFTVVEMY